MFRKVQRGAFDVEYSGNRSSEFKPIAAAATSRCPKLPLIDVHATVELRRAALAAPISTGSPSVVPVPCASRAATSCVTPVLSETL